MKNILILLFWGTTMLSSMAQEVKGYVYGVENGEKTPLFLATVNWLGTDIAVNTDDKGYFEIKKEAGAHMLIASYFGFESDTLHIDGGGNIEFTLTVNSNTIEAIEIEGKEANAYRDRETVHNEIHIGEAEFRKAACCNLSESFETTASVDVNITDAVSGTKRIKMLGLTDVYNQMNIENIPYSHGLVSPYALTYLPSAWVESIQLTKGIGTIVNGYESITGQMNMEVKKPSDQNLFLNLYGNVSGRMEGNAILGVDSIGKWSTALLGHASLRTARLDRNNDGFMDNPLNQTFHVMNRWNYDNPEQGREMKLGVRYLHDNRLSGQMDFDADKHKLGDEYYGFGLRADQLNLFGKFGFINQKKSYKSSGLIISANLYDEESYFGQREYTGQTNSLYINYIYSTIISNTNHTLRLGPSLQIDDYNEVFEELSYKRTEYVPGAFAEYNWKYYERFTLTLGLRGDYNSIYGLYFNPRLHFKYHINTDLSVRVTAGKGQRTTNVLKENQGYFNSARTLVINESNPNGAYGLNQEEAWNTGINLRKEYYLGDFPGAVNVDFYRTDFTNQVVVDLEQRDEINIYNLKGQSYSNSFQVEWEQSVTNHLESRVAYRYLDVQTNYRDGQKQVPFVAKNRFFVNLASTTASNWAFDVTWTWHGKKRLPDNDEEITTTGPEQPNYTPSHNIINMHISKTFKNRLELYTGVENLLNFKQQNPIISAEDPFSSDFDAAMIWGPVFGRAFYAGLYYTL